MPFSRPCQLNNNNKRDYENERVRKVKLKHNFFFLTKKKYKDEETKSRHRKKNLRSKKSKSYRRGTTTFTSPKIKSLRPKPTAIQATKKHHLTKKRQQQNKYRHLISMLSKNS